MSTERTDELKTSKSKKKPNKGPYLLGEALGEGAFAKVRLATQIHIKEKCAIKIVDKRLLEDTTDIQRLKKEIKILKSIRHKNIIQLFDIMESKTNLYFVLEYCKGGELFDYIVKNKRLKETEACIFFQQIINGVEYLHKQGIIHRDLKPENLLLDYNNNIKISDFGLSTFFAKNHFLQTACGTPSYAPPEMLEGLQYNGEASDIWSCGIILYAMLCGTLPFTESKEEIIVQKIKMHDYTIPKYLSKEAQDMLNHILKINPEERFTIDGIKKHPWFNLVKPHLIKGISLNEVIIPVDDNILNMVKEFGFDKDECRNLLLKNKFCSLTSIYYLCLKKYVREGGKSISDLESDLYEEYINNPKNYINQNNEQNINKETKTEKVKSLNKNINNNNMNNNANSNKNNNINKFDKNNSKNKSNAKEKNKNLKSLEKNGNNIEEIKIKEIITTTSNNNNNNATMNNNNNTTTNNNNNENIAINNGNKKIIINKESIGDKPCIANNSKNNENDNKKKINAFKKEQKGSSTKNKQQVINQKKTKDINLNKVGTKNPINSNYKHNNKTIKINNILIQDKKQKIENTKNQQITIKNIGNDTKKNSPSNRNNSNNNEKNNFNTLVIKKKVIKGQINQQKKINISNKKSPKRYIEDNNIKNSSLINSFNTKNKSLENDLYNNNLNINKDETKMNKNNTNSANNKYDKLLNNNKDNKKIIDIQVNEKNIIHSNTITGNNLNSKLYINNFLNNKITVINKEKDIISSNKGIFALGVYPGSTEAINIFYEQSKAKEAYKNYRNCIREGKADTRNKSSPFPIEQFGLDKDLDEKFMEGQKPLNVINYIAKKLVSSSFCGSFNFPSAKKNSTTRRSSAFTNNHLVSNGNLYVNKESNPINEEIEYIKDNSDGGNNGSIYGISNVDEKKRNNGNNDNEKNEFESNVNDNINDINDINFKNLVSILNQKFKKYLTQNNTEIKDIENLTNKNNNNNNNNTHSMSRTKNVNYNVSIPHKNNVVKPQNNKINNVFLNNSSNNKYSKNIDYKEDLYSNSFNTNTNTNNYKSDLLVTTNIDTYAYNINDMTSHYNKFLDISTNYDPGIDSRGGSSVERTDSISKNELRNFSFSEKKNKKRGEHNFKTENDEKNRGNNYNVIKNNFIGTQNKFNKNINIISENEELNQNTMKKIKNNKNIKNKHSPFVEKKVSINLSKTFNNMSKSEYKQKKGKY